MKLVIKIPDRFVGMIGFTTPELEVIAKAVIHGTPLPEDAEILTAEAYSELCLMASELNDIKSEIKALEQQPILDEIRAEIEDIAFDWQEIDGEHESFMVVDLNDALQIIDKYKAESEGKE